MHQPEKGDVFEYSAKHYEHTTNTWAPGSEFELSKFDQELHKRWDAAMKGGAFRYNIDHITTHILPGPKHYVAQLDLLRAKARRNPQEICSISQPFNSKQFNFNWVKPEELIFNVKRLPPTPESACFKAQSQNGTCSGECHALMINDSPQAFGHCLLVPQIDSCLPQILTETALKVALDLILLSKHRGYRLAFNSLCAFASVNHLHFHAYYLEHELVVEQCPVVQLAGPLYEINSTPVPGFAFQLNGWTVEDVSRQVHKVCDYFQETDIAHNMFICRGVIFGECEGSTKTTVRVFLWPRKKFVGVKSEGFNVGSFELGGHLTIKELEGYHNLTEESVDATIADCQLPKEKYAQIKKHVTGIFLSTPDKQSEQKD